MSNIAYYELCREILPASSGNSLAEICILCVKNSILLSMLVIRENVIDKILLLMSISMPSQIIRGRRIQIDFDTFGAKPEFIKVVLTKFIARKSILICVCYT